jgi:hypothetical protein
MTTPHFKRWLDHAFKCGGRHGSYEKRVYTQKEYLLEFWLARVLADVSALTANAIS